MPCRRWGDFSGSTLPLDASFSLVLDDELHVDEGSFDVSTRGGRFAMPDVFAHPLELGPTRMSGRLMPDLGGFEIRQFVAGVEEGSLEADLRLDGWTDDSTIAFSIAIAAMPVDHLSRYWPVVAAPSARHWIVNNLSGGIIRGGALVMRSTLGDLASDDPATSGLEIEVEVEGVTIDYLDGLPPVADVDGYAVIGEDTVAIGTADGQIGGVTAGEGLVTLEGFDGVMNIRVELAGPVADVLTVVAHEPLAYSIPGEFDPEVVSGSLTGVLDITIEDLASP